MGLCWGTSLSKKIFERESLFSPFFFLFTHFSRLSEAMIKHLNKPRFKSFSMVAGNRPSPRRQHTHTVVTNFVCIYFQWWLCVCSNIQSSFGLLCCAHNLESIDPISSASPGENEEGNVFTETFQGITYAISFFVSTTLLKTTINWCLFYKMKFDFVHLKFIFKKSSMCTNNAHFSRV